MLVRSAYFLLDYMLRCYMSLHHSRLKLPQNLLVAHVVASYTLLAIGGDIIFILFRHM
jgi:hypothetical protein